MSIEIEELSKVLYEPSGPSKIGIELEVHDSNGSVSPTAFTDLYEFLLHLLIIGINKFDLNPQESSIDTIHDQLQYYFNRIGVRIHFTLVNLCIISDDLNDEDYHCKIYMDDYLRVVRNKQHSSSKSYTQLYEVAGIYILSDNNNNNNDINNNINNNNDSKKRKLNNTYAIKIQFNYIP